MQRTSRVTARTFLIIFLTNVLAIVLFALVQRIEAETIHQANSDALEINGNGWTMFQHDPAHSGYTESEGPHTPNVLWKRQVSISTRYLVAANGKIFFGSGDLIYCLDDNTGNLLWNVEVYGQVYSVVEDRGKIFVGTINTSSSNDGLIYCLNEANGSLLWSYNPSEREGDKIYGIMPADGRIYANVYVASEGSPQILCLNGTNAALLWNYSLDGEYPASFPTTKDNRVFIISYGLEWINETFSVNHSHLHCVNTTTGNLLWKLDLNLGYPMITEYPTSIVYENILVPLSDTKIGCISVANGGIIWEYEIPDYNSPTSAFAVAYGQIFVGSYRRLDVINATNGELIWGINGTKEGIEFGWTVPLIAKSRLYLSSSHPQGIWCFNTTTGQKLWNHLTSTKIIGTLGSGAITDDKLFIPLYGDDDNSYLFCFEDAEEGVVVWPYVTDRRCDVESAQTIYFQAIWTQNGSAVEGGTIFINGTAYVTNSSGWISFNKAFSNVTAMSWVVTAVNCNGISKYFQMAPIASIVWDRIIVSEGGVSPQVVDVGNWVTVWFKVAYEYDNGNFYGSVFVNGSEAQYSDVNKRWELSYKATTLGTITFEVTSVHDTRYGLKTVNNVAGAQQVTVKAPFSWLVVGVVLILGMASAIVGYFLKSKKLGQKCIQ